MVPARTDIEATVRRWREAQAVSAALLRERKDLIAHRTILAEQHTKILVNLLAEGRLFVTRLDDAEYDGY